MGGSTEAFINLTNLFNKNGYECCLYGSDKFPAKRCNFKFISEFDLNKNDILISHFINPTNLLLFLKKTPQKHILSCHETELFQLKNLNYKVYDKIHFVSMWQKEWHNIDCPNFICSNIIDPKLKNEKKNLNKKVGAVIGSIDLNKQTHICIEKALEDGCENVLLFGAITDSNYFENKIKSLLNEKILYLGIMEDKQRMYNSVTDVYNYSLKETFGLVQGECIKTGTNYHSNFSNYHYMSEEKILNTWLKEFDL